MNEEIKLKVLSKIIPIFEKEIVVFVFYVLFSLIVSNELSFSLQLNLFVIALMIQIYLKYTGKMLYWNNFVIPVFFFGSTFLVGEKIMSNGFSIFLFIVFLTSFLHDRLFVKYSNNKKFIMLSFLNSVIAISSFPILYYIFMKNKVGLNLEDFFNQGNNLLVFSGYFIFYLLILINKQLLAFQVSIYKKMK